MTKKDDMFRSFRIVGTGEGEIPPHWPTCPLWLTPEQRGEFHGICTRLDEEHLLAKADVIDIYSLAVSVDNLRIATVALSAGEKYSTVTRQGRPYQCPACKGSGVRPVPKGRSLAVGPVSAPSDAKATGRPCTVCTAADRETIDAALAAGESFGSVAKRFGTTKSAAFRHKRDHLGRPPRPVLVTSADQTCLGCNGRGLVMPESREVSERKPAKEDQKIALEQIKGFCARMGMDWLSRIQAKGKGAVGRGPSSALRELIERRAAR